MVQREDRHAGIDPYSLCRPGDEGLCDRRMQIMRTRQLQMRMRNDEMLRHRDHVVAQLVGTLDHCRLLRPGHGELPFRRDCRQLKRVGQRKGQLHSAMMSGQGLRPPMGLPKRCQALTARMYGSTVHVDVMTAPQPLGQVGDTARRTQASGFSGLLFTETGRTAYLNAAVASQAAPGLELSTGVAVAFPRSPFVTAASAWELQEATNGKFRLGLGTQVRRHVLRRYGAAFERPGPRLRDYVLAVKACFSGFRSGTLDHHGEFYDLDFITPQWRGGPIDAPDPKVDIAAVNPWMLRMAGEVADGVHIHPLGEPGYINRHAVPN